MPPFSFSDLEEKEMEGWIFLFGGLSAFWLLLR